MATGLGTLDPVAWISDAYTTADAAIKPQLGTGVSPQGSATRAPVMGGLGLTVSKYAQDASAAAQYVAWFNSRDVQIGKIVQHGDNRAGIRHGLRMPLPSRGSRQWLKA